MPLSAQQLNDLRRTALVASDAAYAGDARPVNSPLGPYFDGDNTNVPFGWLSNFVADYVKDDPSTGLKVTIYKRLLGNELIVAFAGTDGFSPVDWSANSFHLGLNQWSGTNRGNVLAAIVGRADANTLVHFTGQSLGGALAQYAAYDLLASNAGFSGRTTLTTFNALGGLAALRDRGGFNPTLANGLLDASHFRITNDLVSKLGEGHFGGKVYEFDFVDRGRYNEHGQNPFFGVINAHRIESGFYANLASVGSDFAAAREVTPDELDYLAIPNLQKLISKWGNPLQRQDTNTGTAFFALIGSLLPAINEAPATEVDAVVQTLYDHAYLADQVTEKDWYWSQQQDFGTMLKNAASQPVLSYGSLGVAIVVDAAVRHLGGDYNPVRDFLAQRGVQLSSLNEQTDAVSDAQYEIAKGLLLGNEFFSDLRFAAVNAQTVLSAMRTAGDWARSARDSLFSFVSANPGDLASLSMRFAGVLERAAAVNTPLSAEHAAYTAEFTSSARLLMLDGAANIAKANPDYVGTLAAADSWEFGSLPSFLQYDEVRDALVAARDDPELVGLTATIEEVIDNVEVAGQRVVLGEGRTANPFDGAGFAGESAVSASQLLEGSVRSFTAYLPYEAGPGGQRISFRLTGSAASKLNVLLDADPIAVGVDAEFDLLIPEGSREITFGLHASQDIDVDETLAISAQLVDSQGIATHQSHLELNLALDATVEPSTNPTNVISGTNLDDNRNGGPTNLPINGTAAADHIRALAGRDEASGQAGDDLLEGGTGADILTGNDGNDRVFADAAMDDAALRAYIASSGAIIDNTDAPTVLSATTADWLVGELGDDTVVGSAAADILFGGGGSDLIVGGAGHDIIDGDDEYMPGDITGVTVTRNWGGNPHEVYFSSVTWNDAASAVGAGDEIHAGAGDDLVRALYGQDTVFGDNGDDTITGDEGDDSLFGGAGNDRIAGGSYGSDDLLVPSGDDYIDGGDGDDILSGESGADVLAGGAGNDELHGFIGTTFVGAPNEDPASDGIDYLSGGAGNDQLVGHGAADTLLGGDDNDQLFGDSDDTPTVLQGDDTLDGGAGNDYLRGYGGNDELLGGQGEDTLQGEDGADRLDGGADDDLLFGMAGDDTLLGDGGDDEIAGGAGNDRVDGGVDDDAIWGEAGDDELNGGANDDYLDGGDGDDTISGGSGGDRVYAMAGNDVVSGGVDADQLVGGSGADQLAGNEDDDALWGEADDDTIAGDEGNDQLMGGDGNDSLDGGDGLDQLFGEAGDDTLSGGGGRDYLVGGAGNDVYWIDGASAEDVIIDDEGQNTLRFGADVTRDELRFRQGIDAAGDDRYLVIEGGGTFSRVVIRSGLDAAVGRFEFADGSSITYAQVMADLAAQNDPSRKPVGSPPPTTIRYGTTANDTITGLSADDWISASAGDDVVEGGEGADRLDGGDGADRLDGGTGNDTLIGGNGMDVYLFGRDRGREVIEERYLSQAGATELDTLELLPGVAPSDVTLHRDGGDLVVAINQTAAQLRVRGYFVPTEQVMNVFSGQFEDWPADHRIEQVRFADGTVWDSAAIDARTLAGTPNTMTGTAGNDLFTVDHADDVVTEAANAGDDTIQSSVSYALRRNVERLTLTGFVDLNAWSTPGNPTSYLTGNAGNNVFNGPGTFYDAAGQPTGSVSGGVMGYAVMAGGAGDDIYHLRDTVGGQVIESAAQGYDTVVLDGVNWTSYQLPANVEALVSAEGGVGQLGGTRYRTGNALDNYLEGSRLGALGTSLANIIDGGAGADTMIGFDDDDRFIVDNPGDVVIDQGVFWGGSQQSTSDEVDASISYELPDSIEILRLTGGVAIDGRGNDLANTLDGTQNVAINRLAGGLGNDLYEAGANDVIEERPGEGIDTVEWNGTGTRVYTADDLPANVEGLTFGEDLGDSGYVGDVRMDRVTGNSGGNDLDGGAGDDVLSGGAGNDTLTGGAGNDVLDGGAGYDVMRFSRGFGQDAIYGDTAFEIAFDATIAVADLLFVDGELRIAGSDDRIAVGYAPTIRFADGTLFAASEVFAMLAASRSTTPTQAADLLTGTPADDAIDALGGDDFIYGRDGADTLTGSDGNDRVYGEGGNDALQGDAGNDRLEGGSGDDRLQGGAGDDTLRAGAGQDDADGGPGNDTLYGDDDDDQLAGGGGLDTLYGGAGNDALTLGTGSGYAAGDAGDDRLTGGAGYDTLWGGSGNDRLEGGGSDDTLTGDVGVDTYVLAPGGGLDLVQDPAIGSELTVIEVAAGLTPADLVLERTIDEYGSSTLRISVAASGDGFELPEFGRSDRPVEVRFADGTVWTPAMVMDRLARVEGTDLDDVLTGSTLDDLLYGLAGNDTLTALEGDDLLDGGAGSDWLEGGAGNDRYVVDDAGDTVSELAFEGVDGVESTLSMTLSANVENLTLVGAALDGTGNAEANTITGNAAANRLDGKQGPDTLIGGAGNDTYVIDSVLDTLVENANEGTDTVTSSISHTLGVDLENLTLTGAGAINATGNASANQLTGNAGANVLDGKAGADTLRGAAGNDTYVVDTLADVLVENASEGTDTVQSTVSFTLAANLENLTLTGAAALNGTGNAVANTLIGNAAANVLDGAAGNDSLRGGAGNDTYIVDATADAVIENAGEGTDTVNASASFTLGSNVENLTLTGAAATNATGNTLANTLTGNGAANTLNGGTGNDTLRGGAGNDLYVVDAVGDVVTENAGQGTDTVQSTLSWTLGANVENLTLTGTATINGTGNTLANTLTGNAAANVLNGGAGADAMAGGAGNDTYVVDNALDSVTEAAAAGTDLVQSTVTFTLAANLENLTLTGASAVNGTGNALANTIQGNAAANALDGGTGADTLRGGAGNDVLTVDNAADIVIENASDGDDTVRSYIAWTLGTNLENLTLVGTSAVNGTGNPLDNWLQGNVAANTLAGADGQDLIFGAAGNDALSGGNGRDILQGGDGNDTIGDTAGNNLLHGGLGVDVLTGGAGSELYLGGAGSDTLTLGAGADLIGFNRGDGQDLVNASTGADNTLSLGGGIRYADVALRKAGNDLVVAVGASEQLTLKDWYLSTSNRHVVNLQMVVDASTDWDAASPDALYNKRVARFDFAGLVTQFDAARAADPTLTQWAVASALASEYVGGSDTAAIGGDLGYQYGNANRLTGIGWTPADGVLASAAFGTSVQTLQSPATLFSGPKTLA